MKRHAFRLFPLALFLIAFTLFFTSCGHEHTFDAWQTTTAATCTTVGERVRTCSCGEVDTQTIPTLAHHERKNTTTKPSCTEAGVATVICTVCLSALRTEPVEATGHKEVQTVVTEPTCTAPGLAAVTCGVCDVPLGTAPVPVMWHDELPYIYNGDITPERDGTATATCSFCDFSDTKTLTGTATRVSELLSGKTVSVLGDSISTYSSITAGALASQTYHSSLRNNTPWGGYGYNVEMGVLSPDLTWWGKTASALGLELLVNNSECGESIRGAAQGRCLKLSPDVGDHLGESPDFIFIFLGTNDFSGVGANVGSSSALTDLQISILAENESYTPKSVAEAYCVMLYRMRAAYPDAKIYCLNILERPDVDQSALAAFNAELSRVFARFDTVTLVDIAADSGIHDDENYRTYVPSNGGTNNVHLGVNGMLAVSRCLQTAILEEYGILPVQE